MEKTENHTEKLTRDETREYYSFNVGNYSRIGSREIASLRSRIKDELDHFENAGHTMGLLKKMRFECDENGDVTLCEIRVKGSWFDNREAITFNRDGFIGFAGWADSTNLQPFLRAFKNWIDNDI